MIVGSDDGNVYAVNPDGSRKWTVAACVGGFVDSSAAISGNGLAYIGSRCGLAAYAVADGGLAWTYTADDVEFTPAIGPDGTLYYPTDRLSTTPLSGEDSLLTALAPPPPPPTTTTPPTTVAPTTTVAPATTTTAAVAPVVRPLHWLTHPRSPPAALTTKPRPWSPSRGGLGVASH